MASTAPADILVLVDGEPATQVSVFDRAFQYGDGLFETLAIHAGRPVWADAHLQRLTLGMTRLGISGLDMAVVRAEMAQLAAGVEHAVLKLVVTRGQGGRGYRTPGAVCPTRVLLRYAWPRQPAHAAETGVRVRCCDTLLSRNARLAGIKHLNRLEQVLARREWSDDEVVEGLMFDEKDLLIEGVSSNVFLQTGEKILTPRLDHCGVHGIVRQKIAEIATILSMQLIEKDIDRGQLQALLDDGAGLFLTNSLIGLWPVRELDGQPVPIPEPVHRLRDVLAQQRGFR
ncbi:MAG TPA: aminodeoxychorismate lyase [Gammaproteobacteria bacterium]|nr:aminodeoxychorismate lyase [Gammaproteobacteria bacterium]